MIELEPSLARVRTDPLIDRPLRSAGRGQLRAAARAATVRTGHRGDRLRAGDRRRVPAGPGRRERVPARPRAGSSAADRHRLARPRRPRRPPGRRHPDASPRGRVRLQPSRREDRRAARDRGPARARSGRERRLADHVAHVPQVRCADGDGDGADRVRLPLRATARRAPERAHVRSPAGPDRAAGGRPLRERRDRREDAGALRLLEPRSSEAPRGLRTRLRRCRFLPPAGYGEARRDRGLLDTVDRGAFGTRAPGSPGRHRCGHARPAVRRPRPPPATLRTPHPSSTARSRTSSTAAPRRTSATSTSPPADCS